MAHSHGRFALFLSVVPLMLVSCLCPLLPSLTDTQGILVVIIDYTGSWYRETFDYARDADNIRHFVLVVPEAEAERVNPGLIFSGLLFGPDGVTLRDERQENAWALDYLYEAPEGYFTGEFEPGTYAIAAAFIAAPLSREEAGVGEDVILWAGVTGGGASTEYQVVTLEAGEITTVTFGMTDANGWACPWLYVFDGHSFQRHTEILRAVRGRHLEQTEITPLGPVTVVNGFIVIQIAEEKDEVSFIDSLSLVIAGMPAYAEADPAIIPALAGIDGHYLTLTQGETVELRFRVPASFAEGDPVSVVVTGYYEPD